MNKEELRKSTQSNFVIFYEGKELKTNKSGGFNSNGGLVLTAKLPTGENIKWRSNGNQGKKGFTFDRPFFGSVLKDAKENSMPQELRNKLEYKL